MDIEYNNKLVAIMKKHGTDKWNESCANDPDYKQALAEKYGFHFEINELPQIHSVEAPVQSKRHMRRDKDKAKGFSLGSYSFRRSKR